MSFLGSIQAFFGQPTTVESAAYVSLDNIFTYLLARINATDAAQLRTLIQQAKQAKPQERDQALLRAYFTIEQFITTHPPPLVDEVYTEQRLRQTIREKVGIYPLPGNFLIIFLPPQEQQFEVYALAIQHLIYYLEKLAGSERVQQLLIQITQGTTLERIVTKEGIDFDIMREIHTRAPTIVAQTQYKQVYRTLYSDLSVMFGKEKAVEHSKQEYAFFKSTYDKTITAQFLSLIPESVLELEQLAFMSREELERKTAERTIELREFSDKLEKKVFERTLQLKQKVDELAEANKHLLDLSQAKTEFISIAAHQLRTPLTALKWALSMLLDDKSLTADQREFLTNGYESNERMIKIINEMLLVLRIESGKMIYTYTTFPIEEVIADVILSFAGLSHEQSVSIVFEKPPEPLPPIKADMEKIRSVLENLVENAINYSKPNSSVSVSVKVSDSHLQVSVADQGMGIPANQQSSIFDKFYRADNASTARPAGSGLGLFVAKNIIERHGGTIGFESVENQGTTFHFTVPLAPRAPDR